MNKENLIKEMVSISKIFNTSAYYDIGDKLTLKQMKDKKLPFAYTDMEPKIPIITINRVVGFKKEVYLAMILHEFGHVLFTKDNKEFDESPMKQQFFNMIEDVRLEYYIQTLYPGFASAFREVNTKIRTYSIPKNPIAELFEYLFIIKVESTRSTFIHIDVEDEELQHLLETIVDFLRSAWNNEVLSYKELYEQLSNQLPDYIEILRLLYNYVDRLEKEKSSSEEENPMGSQGKPNENSSEDDNGQNDAGSGLKKIFDRDEKTIAGVNNSGVGNDEDKNEENSEMGNGGSSEDEDENKPEEEKDENKVDNDPEDNKTDDDKDGSSNEEKDEEKSSANDYNTGKNNSSENSDVEINSSCSRRSEETDVSFKEPEYKEMLEKSLEELSDRIISVKNKTPILNAPYDITVEERLNYTKVDLVHYRTPRELDMIFNNRKAIKLSSEGEIRMPNVPRNVRYNDKMRKLKKKSNIRISFLVDESGSMQYLEYRAYSALEVLFSSFRKIAKVDLYAFDDCLTILGTNVKAIGNKNDMVQARGGTDLFGAIKYLKDQNNPNEQHIIICITDGVTSDFHFSELRSAEERMRAYMEQCHEIGIYIVIVAIKKLNTYKKIFKGFYVDYYNDIISDYEKTKLAKDVSNIIIKLQKGDTE